MVALTFVDLRKAFDPVHLTTVITKATNLQLHSSLMSCLSDFLFHRSHVHQGANWHYHYLTIGVPQGTRMTLLCFLMLINDAMTYISLR